MVVMMPKELTWMVSQSKKPILQRISEDTQSISHTFLTALYPESAMKTSPVGDTATPYGYNSWACAAKDPSPGMPVCPEASVDIMLSELTWRKRRKKHVRTHDQTLTNT